MIEKRGKKSWRVGFQVETPEGRQWVRETIQVDPRLSEAKQRKEAQKALARLQTEVEAGIKGPLRVHTVRSWSEKWLDDEIEPNCSPVTYDNYRYLLDSRILPLIGDVPLAKLTPTMLTDWLNQVRQSPRRSTRLADDQLARKRSPSQRLAPSERRSSALSAKTVSSYYGCMETMLSAAVRLGYLPYNPMNRVRPPRVRRQRAKSLSEEQAVELLRCLKAEPNMCYRAAVLLALTCGLRLGEVGDLKLSDVDWKRGTIDVSRALKYTPRAGSFVGDPKTESSVRPVTLPAGMMALLHETREYQEDCRRLVPHLWKGEGWIVHGWDGRQLHHDTPSKWFRKFADKNGFEGVRFHDLRHTHASILLANNIDVVAVASRIGHSDASTTLRIYAHALARRDKEAAKAMDQLLFAEALRDAEAEESE